MTQIFLVDDDELIREMLGRYLEQKQYQVRLFSTPDDVLEAVSGTQPDLIITDVQMPGMTGLDLVSRLRQNHVQCPVVFITGRPTDEVRDRADALDVVGVWEKSVGDIPSLVALVKSAVGMAAPDDGLGLDRLRMGFLSEVSHEIRTPLTAVRIALEGLLAEATQPLTRDQRTLVDISFRNLDRVIGVVERQLSFLHVTLGEVSIARRLTTLREVLEEPSAPGLDDELSMIAASDQTAAVLFTDPDRLRGIIQHIQRTGDDVKLDVEEMGQSGDIVMTFADTNLSGSCDDATVLGRKPGSPSELERRACHRLIEVLGGTIEIIENGSQESVRITLPVLPPYHRRGDFVAPLKALRELSRLSGKTTALFGCRIIDPDAPHWLVWSREFYQRCLVTMADGDVLVRGREPGSYYLGLLDRNADEIEHILRFLSGPTSTGADEWLRAELHHLLLPGDSYSEDVLLELEAGS